MILGTSLMTPYSQALGSGLGRDTMKNWGLFAPMLSTTSRECERSRLWVALHRMLPNEGG